MAPHLTNLLSLLLPSFILLHLYLSPYTKVEESFNIQAIHDILYQGIPIPWRDNVADFFAKRYDHVAFPGPVPRTFVGALMISGVSWPWKGVCEGDYGCLQGLVRATLGLLNGLTLILFSRAISRAFGRGASIWYILLQASQFHVIYYASRTLPNMFAFGFTTLSLTFLLKAHTHPSPSHPVPFPPPLPPRTYLSLSLFLLTISTIIFRSELLLLLLPLTLHNLLLTPSPLRFSLITRTIIPSGILGALFALPLTLAVDSYFWNSWTYPVWPELGAFWYNTILGHSSAWGISPWHYYFTSALPRLLLNPLIYTLCIPAATLHPATSRLSRVLLVPSLAFTTLYSFLAHKEARFIIYAVPALTGVAGAGASLIWTRRAKSPIYALLSLALAGSILLSLVASTALLGISSLNYPGGEAMRVLHRLAAPDAASRIGDMENGIPDTDGDKLKGALNIYLDNLACQTGVTRFLEDHSVFPVTVSRAELGVPGVPGVPDVVNGERRRFTYNKSTSPSLLLDPLFWNDFTHAVVERPEKAIGKWAILDTVYGYDGIAVLRPGMRSSARSTDEESGWVIKDSGKEEGVGRGRAAVKERVIERISRGWKGLERMVRDPLLRGYWVEIRMAPKLYILKQQPHEFVPGSGANAGADGVGAGDAVR